jgi:hypothetical protein
MNTANIVQKLWNYCNVLRDDGMSYGDYVEQLTYLLFLKTADERTRPPYKQPSPVPEQYAWSSLIRKDGDELFDHYRHTLEALGNEIINRSQSREHDFPSRQKGREYAGQYYSRAFRRSQPTRQLARALPAFDWGQCGYSVTTPTAISCSFRVCARTILRPRMNGISDHSS